MEYSLQNLNKISNLKNLTLTNFIEKLNLIGLEIDNVSEEEDKLKRDLVEQYKRKYDINCNTLKEKGYCIFNFDHIRFNWVSYAIVVIWLAN